MSLTPIGGYSLEFQRDTPNNFVTPRNFQCFTPRNIKRVISGKFDWFAPQNLRSVTLRICEAIKSRLR